MSAEEFDEILEVLQSYLRRRETILHVLMHLQKFIVSPHKKSPATPRQVGKPSSRNFQRLKLILYIHIHILSMQFIL